MTQTSIITFDLNDEQLWSVVVVAAQLEGGQGSNRV